MKRLLLAVAAAMLLPMAAHAQSYGNSFYHAEYGGPNSLQHQIDRSGLNLEDFDVEGPDRFTEAGDADTVGGAATYWNGGGNDGERFEGRYQKAWRPFEGSRTRLVVDVPVDVMTFNPGFGIGQVQSVLGSVSVGAEIPVNPNWSLTPRFAYGLQGGSDFFGNGEMVSASVTSRYRIPDVGRGEIIIGNMVGYTETINTGIVSQPFFRFGGSSENWAFRDGIAYQFPLNYRMFGRQTSMRISYVNTHLTGDPVAEDDLNEVALSVGVRMRETELRNKFEALRLGVLYTFSTDGYNAGTLTLGYRF